MKKSFSVLVMVFILYFVVLAVGPASAQVPTSTPHPSSTPKNTLTPTPTIDCPPGLPEGWGTYTPSPLWMLECEPCLNALTPTSTGLPSVTPTHSGTGTPYPTFTPTGTVTPTATPQLDLISLNGSPFFDLIPINWVSVQTIGDNTFTCQDMGNYIYCAGVITVYDPDPSQDDWLRVHVPITAPETTPIYSSINLFGSMGWGNSLWASNDTYAGNGYARLYGNLTSYNPFMYPNNFFTMPFSGDPNGLSNMILVLQHLGSAGNVWNGTFTYEWYISPYPNLITPTPTTTPTVTPTIVNDLSCGSVSTFDTGFDFELFIPDGEANCSMGWDEFGFLEYTVPAVQICLQPVQFGVIRMYGQDYEVGIYGLVGAVAFLYRFLKTI